MIGYYYLFLLIYFLPTWIGMSFPYNVLRFTGSRLPLKIAAFFSPVNVDAIPTQIIPYVQF